MRSLASATQTTSSVVSSTTVSAVDVSFPLTMSENFQNPPLLGTPNSVQLSLPGASNAASLTGSACNFSHLSAPAVSSAWLLPTAPGTFFQPLVGSAYLYQHSSTTMLPGVTGQSQLSTSAASYPGVFEWDMTRGTKTPSSSLSDCTVTVIDQNTARSSRSMAPQYDKTSDGYNMVPLYPSISASLVPRTPSQILNHGHSLSLPYQEGSQVYYYNQSALGHLLSGELGPCLQSYGSVSYTGSGVSASQPEMVMVLKEVQPTSVLSPASTSGIYYPVSAQPIAETGFQVMETSLGLQSSKQTFHLPQTSIPKSCKNRNVQILESNPPSELGEISMVTPVESSSNLLALPSAPSQEQNENNTFDIKIKLSKPLDAYQIPLENQDPPLLPLEIPDIYQLLACIDPPGQGEQPGFDNTDLGKNSLSLKDKGTLEKNGIESRGGSPDITMVEDFHVPQLFNSLNDLDQSEGPEVIKAKETTTVKLNQAQEKSNVIKAPSDQDKNKRKASEPIGSAPKAKTQSKNPECPLEEEVVICNITTSDRAPVNTAKHSSNSKPKKAASSRIGKTKSHGQEKSRKTRENHSKETEENEQSGNRVQAEEKPIIPKMKRKKNQPELSQETFIKPRTFLGMHMLESVQVFHALGKRSDKKTGLSSSRALGNSSNPKGPQPATALKRWRDTSQEEKGPEKTQVKPQKPDGSADKECSSPSQYERPPPGKVKLVPLPFPTLDKPQARPVHRRPQSLAPHRHAVTGPAQPVSNSANSAQPTAVNSVRPAPVSLTGPARPARPILTQPTQPCLANPTRPSGPQSAAPRPAPYKIPSFTSVQRKPIPTAVTKVQPPPKPQTQYLLEDFSLQPNPWRKPNVPEPVMSKPITNEQRPEREAMKKKAQQERENAAKYTALGKLQFFIEREKDMDIARYHGYAI